MIAVMATISLKAHFNGQHIVLDEPFSFPENAQLIVTVLHASSEEALKERDSFADTAARELSRAYGEDEPEYTAADIRERI